MNHTVTQPTQSAQPIQLPNQSFTLVTADAVTDSTFAQLLQATDTGLIVYFYPKDNTSGCTTQATEFSHLHTEFAELGYSIVGISRNSVKSHQNFITKHDLHIPLISDSDETLCRHFDVIKPKQMYGKTHLGVVRSTFVFNKQGVMTHRFDKVNSKKHQQTLLEALSTE